MNFVQPSIDPVIFSLFFIDIRWYSLAYIFGLVFGLLVIRYLNKVKGNLVTNAQLDSFFIWIFLGIILGGRIGYVIFYQIDLFIKNPIYVFEIWNGGMSFHGGLLGVITATYLFSRLNKIKFFYLTDLVAVVAPIGLFLGRIANFINSELIGKPTEFFISVIYPTIDNLKRHPSQLYEAFFEGVILFLILLIHFYRTKHLKNFGSISALFLIFYSLFRFLIEYLREPDTHIGLYLNFISMGQILCIPFFIFGILIIWNVRNKKNK